jgi:hypothetical protein
MKELKLVSSNAIIAELYQDFNIAGSEWVHKAKRWVARGIEIMELSGYFERTTLWDTVEEYSVILPCDLRVLGVILVGASLDSACCDSSLPTATTPAVNSTDENGVRLDILGNGTVTGLVRLPLSASLTIGKPFEEVRCANYARGYINNGRLHTNFETGKVMFVYYRPPLDNEGFPMIPDFGLTIEALNFWIIAKMSMGGFQHPVFSYDKAWAKWMELYPQARNKVNYPSLEEMQGFTEMINNPIIGDWANKLYFQ